MAEPSITLSREGDTSKARETESVQFVRQDALLVLSTCPTGKVRASPEKLLTLLEEAFGCDDLATVDTPLTMEASEKLLHRVCAAYGIRAFEIDFDRVVVREGPVDWESTTFGSAVDRMTALSEGGDGHYMQPESQGVYRKAHVEGDNVFYVAQALEASFTLGQGVVAECKRARQMPICRRFFILYYLHGFVNELCRGMPATSPLPWALAYLFKQPLERAKGLLLSTLYYHIVARPEPRQTVELPKETRKEVLDKINDCIRMLSAAPRQ